MVIFYSFLLVITRGYGLFGRGVLSQEPNPPAAPSGAVVHIRINEEEAISGGPWEDLSDLK